MDWDTALYKKYLLNPYSLFQVGTGARSDKIRTYNFNQDRVTDHRIGYNMHNLSGFLVGGEDLDDMIDGLLTESQREQLLELLLEHKDTVESTKSAAKSRSSSN